MDGGPRRGPEARLANEVAHELGTALALIAGYADTLREGLGSPAGSADVAASLDGIDRGVERLRGISDQLAEWARAGRVPAPGDGSGEG
jgi:signal transduction histidine kinase